MLVSMRDIIGSVWVLNVSLKTVYLQQSYYQATADFEQLCEVTKTILKKRNPTFVKRENRGRETSQKVFTVIEAYGALGLLYVGVGGLWEKKERERVCFLRPRLIPKKTLR